ncbi:hypothetical protein ABID37_003905 [Aquamicrobium terrae]|uniref:Uncharacterized protein n=1 Tax=Aquamicrobium terrae TaxID=1324945 RepID=A0ABV2N3L8_9HYPH
MTRIVTGPCRPRAQAGLLPAPRNGEDFAILHNPKYDFTNGNQTVGVALWARLARMTKNLSSFPATKAPGAQS